MQLRVEPGEGAGLPWHRLDVAAGETAVTHLAWAAGALAAALGLALAATRTRRACAAPRLAASAAILTLAGIGLMPPLLLACAAAALGTAAGRGGHTVAGVCVLASRPIGPGQLVLYRLAAALAAHTIFLAAAALRAARRAELRGLTLGAAAPRRLADGGTAWIVPAEQPIAHCAGLNRPRAVVSTGLLGLLTPAEQEAVLSHEVAHIRLGHPRILLLGAVIARSYRWLPRPAWPGPGCAATWKPPPTTRPPPRWAPRRCFPPSPRSPSPQPLPPRQRAQRGRRSPTPATCGTGSAACSSPGPRVPAPDSSCAWRARCSSSRSPRRPARHCTPAPNGQAWSPAWPPSATWAGGRPGAAAAGSPARPADGAKNTYPRNRAGMTGPVGPGHFTSPGRRADAAQATM